MTGYGISGLKSEIELLSNGQAVPYIGIRGLDVTAEIEAQGIPGGVYVRTVETDSPAMAAGSRVETSLRRQQEEDNITVSLPECAAGPEKRQ